MSRIRTIKPEFFTHEDLFEAEQESGLPLRLAFAGLWTQCDREGRFNWRPRQLKVAIMPYDVLDFSRVLDALSTRGFVVKYMTENRDFGFIPSWHRHQVINNRERASDFPPPPENIEKVDVSITRAPRVDHACSGERKGKEGKGKEEEPNGSLSEVASDAKPKSGKSKGYPEAFEKFWVAYPTTPNMSKAKALVGWKRLTDDERDACYRAVQPYKAFLASKPAHPVMHATTFINEKRFDGFTATIKISEPATDEVWVKRLKYGRRLGRWNTPNWGPAPGRPGSHVPAHLLETNDGADWREMELAA